MSYFRSDIEAMKGYTPGEQPKGRVLVKLNTNENPFPPSPKVIDAIRNYPFEELRKYPAPYSDSVREAASKVYNIPADQIIAGNGSDDILTILFRSFVAEGNSVGWLNPSYSLYPVLANIQGGEHLTIDLKEDFSLPENLAEKAKGSKLFFITRPNAPTGNAFEKERLRQFVADYDGVVVIDEAYADFCTDNCFDMIDEFPNLIITRTLSKSYSLAGIRAGLAFSNKNLIQGMHKVRDSYNVNGLSQAAATAALLDQEYFLANTAIIIKTRESVEKTLKNLGFDVKPSEANFLFCIPPMDAEKYTHAVKEGGFLIRYFKTTGIDNYVRISIGSENEMDEFLSLTATILKDNK
ncbi:histidinol-phosphate transaminase [Lentisphaera profundi]|uniref:Histidinol-phosphate aminotransferase n=1 Tax=Lentisphaera profundi TaxID=1658616 RepID=A0ABY7VYK0_9BACT|nr:histidinol-phosphate transaminase [Lentisphaera profundi]WDE97138.1 histidinol-phosphate transaminase [Lentisphaera profundi]